MPTSRFILYDRDGIVSPESKYEKIVLLPAQDESDPCAHAWADARFAIDIMMEHALFFVLLMPPETCQAERNQAQQFQSRFFDLYKKVDSGGVPKPESLKSFCLSVVDSIKPFIEYKQKMFEAQTDGELRSLVWPLFFKHTLDEAQRWCRRLSQVSDGNAEYARPEVVQFWSGVVEEHQRFKSHLLDPDEKDLITTCEQRSIEFQGFETMCASPNGCPKPSDMVDPVLSAAQSVLDFERAGVLGIEAATIKSIIDPRLADHLRRETVKFVDEIQRAV